jgi:hypothetical protein
MGTIPSQPERIPVRPEYPLPEILSIAITVARQAMTHGFQGGYLPHYHKLDMFIQTKLGHYSPQVPILEENDNPSTELWWRVVPLFVLPERNTTVSMISLYQHRCPRLITRVLSVINPLTLYCCFQDTDGILQPTIRVSGLDGITALTNCQEIQQIGGNLTELTVSGID